MEPIQINVTVKFDDTTQAFLSSLFGGLVKLAGEQQKPAEPKPAEQAKPVAEQAKPAPAEPAPAKPAEPKPAEPKPAEPAPAEPAEPVAATTIATAPKQSSITIDSLRELAMTKMNAHRVEIKQKLTELGTPSITKLDVSKYQEMHDFLKSLE